MSAVLNPLPQVFDSALNPHEWIDMVHSAVLLEKKVLLVGLNRPVPGPFDESRTTLALSRCVHVQDAQSLANFVLDREIVVRNCCLYLSKGAIPPIPVVNFWTANGIKEFIVREELLDSVATHMRARGAKISEILD